MDCYGVSECVDSPVFFVFCCSDIVDVSDYDPVGEGAFDELWWWEWFFFVLKYLGEVLVDGLEDC